MASKTDRTEQEIWNAVYNKTDDQLCTSIGVANSNPSKGKTVQEILNASYNANSAELNAN